MRIDIGSAVVLSVVHIGTVVAGAAGKVHVAAHIEPFGGLVGSLQTCGIAFVVGCNGDTLAVEIAQRGVELALLPASVDVDVVFLAEGIAIGFVDPVVRHDGVHLTVVVHAVAQCGIGVELAVVANQILAGRHGIRQIAQAALARCAVECVVGVEVGLIDALPLGDIGIVERLVVGF